MEDATILPIDSTAQATEACEREVLRLLLNYPAQPLTGDYTVATYLLAQVEETPFRTRVYAQLLEICLQSVDDERYPDARAILWLEFSDELRRTIKELVPNAEQLSPEWIQHSLTHPYSLAEREQLQQACDNAVLRLNKVNVERELSECLCAMQATDPNNIEEYLGHLAIFRSLKKLDIQLAGLLGTYLEVSPTVPKLPKLPKQPSIGEAARSELQGFIDEMEAALAPLRTTRHRAHYDIQALLTDPESRPTVVAQMEAADALTGRAAPRHLFHHYRNQRLSQTWAHADAAERQLLQEQYACQQVSYRLNALRMLISELEIGLKRIVGFMPEAFTLTYFKDCHLSK